MRVGVTGITSDLGRAVLPLLEADARIERIIGIDISKPEAPSAKLDFVRADLTRPDAEADLLRTLREARLDALCHLAFVNSRVHGAAFAHELEVIGTMHVLAAAQTLKLPRLIVPSLTVVYGAQPASAALNPERHPLLGTGARFVTDRVEVEHHVEAFAERNPGTHVVVLRFAPIVGPNANNPFTRLLRNGFVPTVLGFDPLWQIVHEDDAARALQLALFTEASGAFNIVGSAPMPFSTLVRLAKVATAPMPGPLLRTTIRFLEAAGVASVPVSLLDFLKYSWLADGRRAAKILGFSPRVDTQVAMASILAAKGT